MMTFINKIPHETTIDLKSQIDIVADQISSKTIVQRLDLGMTLFALDKGQIIQTHTTNGDALVNNIEGVAKIVIDEKVFVINNGQSIVMPANVPHSLIALESFKMLLIVVKPEHSN